jgi:hypothetical protein
VAETKPPIYRYALTAGTAALLAGNQIAVIAAAVCGIMLGWVVAAVAFLPHALWVLLTTPLAPAVCAAVGGVSAIGSLLFVADYWFYGRFTVRLRWCPPKLYHCLTATCLVWQSATTRSRLVWLLPT